ncbi:MAG: SulP family inorganic anion transporter, partial [Bacteroidota bacterium]
MSSNEKKGFFANLKNDLPAAVVVFLVAMPLCLGIALASGAEPIAGIIAGIVGGTIVALVSGSPLGVSGPAAGLAVIVLNAIEDLGAFDIFLVAVVIAGVIQVILGILKAGVIGYYFPNAVIKGMLAGIGIVIFMKQIPHFFGCDKDYLGDLSFFQRDGKNTITELGEIAENITPGSIVIAIISLLILILWEQKFMKKLSFTNIIQGPLVVVVSGILLALAFQGTSMNIGPEHFVKIPILEDGEGIGSLLTFPDFSGFGNPKVLVVEAVPLAVRGVAAGGGVVTALQVGALVVAHGV